jgi:D-amino peptidase
MDILISADIEGITGITSKRMLKDKSSAIYAKACRLMTNEVNAAAEACIESGCEKIYVADAHSAGKNIIRKKLNKKCTLLKKTKKLKMMTGAKKVDAVLFIGYHGMAGKKNSFCAHTNSTKAIKSLYINRKEAGEAYTNALLGKYYNVKAIFISGTDKAVSETKKAIPSIHSVINLKSLSHVRAESKKIPANLEKIKKEIKKAIKNFNKIKMIKSPVKNVEFKVNTTLGESFAFSAENVVLGYKKYRRIIIKTLRKIKKINQQS